MGADGGTIPKRQELIHKRKRPAKLNKKEQSADKWRNCQLSHQPLQKPIIACRSGRLYNKEAILEGLINKTLSSNQITKHIKKRSDFKELRLTDNKDYKGDGPMKGNTYIDDNNTKWMCPITSLPMNGITSFVANFDCGCVVSKRAIVETKAADVCLNCGGPMSAEKMVDLYSDAQL